MFTLTLRPQVAFNCFQLLLSSVDNDSMQRDMIAEFGTKLFDVLRDISTKILKGNILAVFNLSHIRRPCPGQKYLDDVYICESRQWLQMALKQCFPSTFERNSRNALFTKVGVSPI